MLTYADVCWRMLRRMLKRARQFALGVTAACKRMLTYAETFADVCWCMLACAGVCWRLLTYAGV
jgi:hypothetical protein